MYFITTANRRNPHRNICRNCEPDMTFLKWLHEPFLKGHATPKFSFFGITGYEIGYRKLGLKGSGTWSQVPKG